MKNFSNTTIIKSPVTRFKEHLYPYFKKKKPINSIRQLAEIACNSNLMLGTDFKDFKQLSDLAELVMNSFIIDHYRKEFYDNDSWTLGYLEHLQGLLPSETERSRNQMLFQQFSTPLPLTYLMCLAADVRLQDHVFEPSAGTGTLAAMASTFKPSTIMVNDLCPFRYRLLLHLLFRSSNENALYLHHQEYFKELKPSVILMNPPFARSAGRLKNKRAPMEAAMHISSALKLLRQGGRLVTITGKGMNLHSITYKKWWEEISSCYSIKANVLLGQDFFSRKGTRFETRLIVIDKSQVDGKIITGRYDTAAGLLPIVKAIAISRL